MRSPPATVAVAALQSSDWEAVREIYRAGIGTGHATFETDVPSWTAWDAAHRTDCRLVARVEGQLVAWTALSAVSRRAAYAGVAEVSIYVAAAARGRGIGKTLLAALTSAADQAGIWTSQATVLPENQVSVALFKACGFREVGVRQRSGQLHRIWRDVLLLERRSLVSGV